MANDWKVAGGGYAARRWLQSGDAAEMRRNADRAAAIAADSAGGAECRNRGRFAAARSARGAIERPWIVGAAGDEVVGFVIGKKFRTVGLAQDDGPGRSACGPLRVASSAARCPSRNLLPHSVGSPAISKLSFTVTGTPCKGPSGSPCAIAASARFAASRA